MIFNEENTLTAFSMPIIHTFSKNSNSIGDDFQGTLKDRPNVLLMGDSHGDPNMVKDQDLTDNGVCLRYLLKIKLPSKIHFLFV